MTRMHSDNSGTELVTGNATWHWPGEPEGEHLIGFDTVSEQRRFAPGQHLSDGISLTVIQGERRARAIHLPPPVIINLRESVPAADDLLTDEQLDYFQANGNNALIYVHATGAVSGGRHCHQPDLPLLGCPGCALGLEHFGVALPAISGHTRSAQTNH